MGAELEKKLGITVEYIKSGGGRFEVMANGTLLYSKKATGQFPENGDIVSNVKKFM